MSVKNRLEALERQVSEIRACTDSEFRRRVRALSPWPLQQVYEFHLVLKPKFWQETLKVTPDEWATRYGDFPVDASRISIERWRSHRQVRLYEGAAKACPTRRILLSESVALVAEIVHLWRVGFPQANTDWRWVELYLQEDSIRLGIIGGEFGHDIRHDRNLIEGPGYGPSPAGMFVDVPLHHPPTALEKYRTLDDEQDEEDSAGERYYQHADEAAGLAWSLSVQDLQSLHESEIADLLLE